MTTEHPGPSQLDLKKDFVIRQDRLSACLFDAFLQISEKMFEIIDCTPFGVSVYSDEEYRTNLDGIDAKFQIDGIITQDLCLRLIRSEKVSETKFKTAFEVISAPLDISVVLAAHHTSEALSQFSSAMKIVKEVPEDFRKSTLELNNYLQRLKEITEEVELKLESTSIEDTRKAYDTAAQVLANFVQTEVGGRLNVLGEALSGCDEEVRKRAFEFFRENLGSITKLAPFSERSLTKPLGYAGDYEMMNMIYRDEPLGKSLMGKCLHKYMINMSGGIAVKNRSVYLKDKILSAINKKGSVKSISIASGPAMEVQLLLKEVKDLSKSSFHLLDQDLSSLKYAQRALGSAEMSRRTGAKFEFFNTNIRSVIGRGLKEKDYDLIYSAGLFDYFSDSVAFRAAEKLMASLKPGGELIIGNFDITSPSKLFMEMAWDWNLIYRSRSDLDSIFSSLGTTRTIENEPEEVNLFYVIRK